MMVTWSTSPSVWHFVDCCLEKLVYGTFFYKNSSCLWVDRICERLREDMIIHTAQASTSRGLN